MPKFNERLAVRHQELAKAIGQSPPAFGPYSTYATKLLFQRQALLELVKLLNEALGVDWANKIQL